MIIEKQTQDLTNLATSLGVFIFYFFYHRECLVQLVRTLTNLTGPKINDYISLQ